CQDFDDKEYVLDGVGGLQILLDCLVVDFIFDGKHYWYRWNESMGGEVSIFKYIVKRMGFNIRMKGKIGSTVGSAMKYEELNFDEYGNFSIYTKCLIGIVEKESYPQYFKSLRESLNDLRSGLTVVICWRSTEMWLHCNGLKRRGDEIVVYEPCKEVVARNNMVVKFLVEYKKKNDKKRKLKIIHNYGNLPNDSVKCLKDVLEYFNVVD
ncbi:hypothetical protein SNEBB_003222, partial [Seison nebaliae]